MAIKNIRCNKENLQQRALRRRTEACSLRACRPSSSTTHDTPLSLEELIEIERIATTILNLPIGSAVRNPTGVLNAIITRIADLETLLHERNSSIPGQLVEKPKKLRNKHLRKRVTKK